MTETPAPTTAQEVIALHNSSSWVDKPGYLNGSMIRCACGWTADCAGHNGTTRRTLWPQHVADELAAVGVVAANETLRAAAQDLRRPTAPGPYLNQSGHDRDGRGHNSETIDSWYAAWLESRAGEATATEPEITHPAARHPVTHDALRMLGRFLGMPTKVNV